MTYHITPEKLEELKQELEILKGQKRNDISDRLRRAKEFGDLSENSEYVEAREEQTRVEARIYEIEDIMKHASIIKKGDGGKEVRIGSTIIVEKGKEKRTFMIVGSEESKPDENKISNESPLGAAFLGKEAGDSVTVSTPNGPATYKITRIE